MVNAKWQKASSFKQKRGSNTFQKEKKNMTARGKPNNRKHIRGQHTDKKKDRTKINYYNYGTLGHFTRECTLLKKVQFISIHFSCIYVTYSVFLTESHPLWIVDLRAINHIARDRGAFMKYR